MLPLNKVARTFITWKNASACEPRPDTPMGWLQVATAAGQSQPEDLEAAFSELGAVAVWLSDAGDNPVLEPAPGETPGWPATIVTALFEATQGEAALRQRLQQALPHIELTLQSVAERDWQTQWQQSLQPRQFGARLWVVPDSKLPDGSLPEGGPPTNAAVVTLQPGMAFGTGEHPTTAMCLEWLAAQQPTGKRVIDYGCGSGLLAIAALALGARECCAVDIDPQALTATRQNAARNDCLEQLFIVKPDAVPATTQYDVLVANILSGTLIELAGDLCRLTHSGAAVALTGILAHQADDVIAAWSDWAELAITNQQDDWVLLSGTRLENTDQ